MRRFLANPYSVIFFALLGLAVLGVVVAVSLLTQKDAAPVTVAQGHVLLLILGLVPPLPLAVLYSLRRDYQIIEQMRNGNNWLHWTYGDTDHETYNGKVPNEVYAGSEGLFMPGFPPRLRDFNNSLTDIRVESGRPGTLVFRYSTRRMQRGGIKRSPLGRAVEVRNPSVTADMKEYRIPIPRGCEDEAWTLARNWQERKLKFREPWISPMAVTMLAVLIMLAACVLGPLL